MKDKIKEDVWQIFRKSYSVTTDTPQTLAQEQFLNKVADYVHGVIIGGPIKKEPEHLTMSEGNFGQVKRKRGRPAKTK